MASLWRCFLDYSKILGPQLRKQSVDSSGLAEEVYWASLPLEKYILLGFEGDAVGMENYGNKTENCWLLLDIFFFQRMVIGLDEKVSLGDLLKLGYTSLLGLKLSTITAAFLWKDGNEASSGFREQLVGRFVEMMEFLRVGNYVYAALKDLVRLSYGSGQ